MRHTRRAARPLPALLRPPIRFLLRAVSRYPKAPGYLYQIVERCGARLAVQPLECQLFNGMKMTCDLADQIQRQIYFVGAYEPIEVYLLRYLLRPGMVVIDAGANVGQHTLIAAGEVGLVVRFTLSSQSPRTSGVSWLTCQRMDSQPWSERT